VVICAEQHASRLVVPQSQRTPATAWASHRDHARKALHKLATPHLPASLAQLRRAVERAHREARHAVETTSTRDEDEAAATTAEDQGDSATEVTGETRADAPAPTDDEADAPTAEQ
jgi:hypothetical protein